MTLSPKWKRIVRKAWSFRLTVLAGFLSGLELLLPLWVESFPRGVFAFLTMVVVIAAGVARVIAQRDFDD